MKRFRPLAFLGLALVLALVTSVLIFTWLQNEKSRLMAAPLPVAPKGMQVLVVNADLSWGTKLKPEMLQLQEFPSGSVPEGHFTDAGTANDRVLLVDIKRNEMLLESKLAPIGTTSGGVAAVKYRARVQTAERRDRRLWARRERNSTRSRNNPRAEPT